MATIKVSVVGRKVSDSQFKIAIIGAGYSGTALAASLCKLSQKPLDIVMFDKSRDFGVGDAYRTPFSFHLLNVRAKEMSAFDDKPNDFVDWLKVNYTELDKQTTQPLAEQFVPRCLYRAYLQTLITSMRSSNYHHVNFEPNAVIAVERIANQVELTLSDHRKIKADKVILALGNNSPAIPPFPVSGETAILAPWDYRAPTEIPAHDPVLIVGTGLSMIDAVLTLHHHQHQGKIYAVSRHGLLPLPHTDHSGSVSLQASMPYQLRILTKQLRLQSKEYMKQGGDWRSVISALRENIHDIWRGFVLEDKKQFLRHALPYWNIHRHRVHQLLADLLSALMEKKQLHVLAGRVIEVADGAAKIRLRHSNQQYLAKINHIINCTGPGLTLSAASQPIIDSLFQQGLARHDALKLGLDTTEIGALKEQTGKPSTVFYTLGALRKGELFAVGSVPEIRKQVFDLARHLIA